MILLLKSINKGSEIRLVDHILSASTIHDHFFTVTSHYSQQSKYAT